MEFLHIPVMLEECMIALDLKDDGIYFDGTLGGGNHSYEILNRTRNSMLFATDLDACALEAAEKKLSCFNGRYKLVHDNFKNFLSVKENLGLGLIDGALLDLGVSSYQLDERSRGFSYMADDVRLDMRMDSDSPLTAYDVVNEYSEKRLKEILFLYGEERFSANIAANIVKERAKAPVTTTGELVRIIEKSIPAKFKKDGHPAKRSFQAIRIEVNGELDGLDKCLHDIASGLKSGGRLAVITFHSLEDRIVKRAFVDLATGCTCDRSIPICVCGRKEQAKLISKKPITATEQELKRNPRSSSAKLRVIEKL